MVKLHMVLDEFFANTVYVFAQILLMRSHIKCILSCTYIWKHPFAVIPKIGVHRKTLVLKSYFIETANLQFETCLEKTPA